MRQTAPLKGLGYVGVEPSGEYRAKFFLFIGNQKGKAGLERCNRKLEEIVAALSAEKLSFEVTADEWQVSFRCFTADAARERVAALVALARSLGVET